MTTRRDRHVLILCFNEDYTQNLTKLKTIYGNRFSQIACITPDHCGWLDSWYKRPGNPPYALIYGADRIINRLRRAVGRRNAHEAGIPMPVNIWRVQGFKYYFQDFFWQARHKLLELPADWYWFIADDLLLHSNLNEENISSTLIRDPRSKSVLCKPAYAADAWTAWFHGSVERVVASLRACGTYPPDSRIFDFPADPTKSDANSQRVISSCADFFGCHREMLMGTFKRLHMLAKYKVFVEVAIPNTILTLDPYCSYLDSYEWDFAEDRGSKRKIEAFIASSGERVFYHPFKLSAFDESWLVRNIASAGRPS